MQQCFVCFFPPYLCAAFSCKQLNFSLLSYMSSQHHAGLQPANLVTAQHVLRSRRRDLLFGPSFFHTTSSFQSRIPASFHITSSFHPVFLRLLYTVFFIQQCVMDEPRSSFPPQCSWSSLPPHCSWIYFYSAARSSQPRSSLPPQCSWI